MPFSQLKEIRQSRSTLEAFGGYNHNLKISDGEFYDMNNLTSDNYPVLSPREKRKKYTGANSHYASAMTFRDKLCYFAESDDPGSSFLYVDGVKVPGLYFPYTEYAINMGAYLVSMPGGMYVNLTDYTDYGYINKSNRVYGGVTITQCDKDGNDYDDITVSGTAPENPANSDMWIDTSQSPYVLKSYSETNSMWISVPTTYMKFKGNNIADGFKIGDGIRTGERTAKLKVNNAKTVVNGNTFVIQNLKHTEAGTDDYLVVIGITSESEFIYDTTGFLVERVMPTMDYVIESGNRLWGCRYGKNIYGDFVNEIYASKLGDFTNWNCFEGVSTDSYAASCGTSGKWTSAVNYNGNPIFFKESFMHKVYGTYPANYQINMVECHGVQDGSSESAVVINNRLFYKSIDGVCMYDGSLPTDMGNVFGEKKYKKAKGGSFKNKYYLSMQDAEIPDTEANSPKRELFVFDTVSGLWHKEDGYAIDGFCSTADTLYCQKIRMIDSELTETHGNDIEILKGNGTDNESTVNWFAETGILGMTIKSGRNSSTSLPGKKYISSIIIRLGLAPGSKVDFYVQYDSSGIWEHTSTVTGINIKSFLTTIRPKRCDHFKIKMVGEGDAKIYSMCQNIEQGSEY